MGDAIIILAVFSVPLTAIISSVWLKGKKLDAENGGTKLREALDVVKGDNADLKRRIEVLESIAIDSRDIERGAIESNRRDGIAGSRTLEEMEREREQQQQLPSSSIRR